jgi:hypothetical protein
MELMCTFLHLQKIKLTIGGALLFLAADKGMWLLEV